MCWPFTLSRYCGCCSRPVMRLPLTISWSSPQRIASFFEACWCSPQEVRRLRYFEPFPSAFASCALVSVGTAFMQSVDCHVCVFQTIHHKLRMQYSDLPADPSDASRNNTTRTKRNAELLFDS